MSHLISSFQIDHTNLKPGIYVSRRDKVGNQGITTFDIRMTNCNREPAIASAAMHTIEHLGATFLRNHKVWGNRIVYFGPMGCLSGSYLIMKGRLEVSDIVKLVVAMMKDIVTYKGKVPGATKSQCGNFLLHDLPMAKVYATQYLAQQSVWEFTYPTCQRAKDKSGRTVYDA